MNRFALLVALIAVSAAVFGQSAPVLAAPEGIAALPSQSQNESSDVNVNNTNATTPAQPTPMEPQPNPPWAWLPISYSPQSKSIAVR